jgi:hypothetical protein
MTLRIPRTVRASIAGLGELSVHAASMNDIISFEDLGTTENLALESAILGRLVKRDDSLLTPSEVESLTDDQRNVLLEAVLELHSYLFSEPETKVKNEDGERVVDVTAGERTIHREDEEGAGTYFMRGVAAFNRRLAKVALRPFQSLAKELSIDRVRLPGLSGLFPSAAAQSERQQSMLQGIAPILQRQIDGIKIATDLSPVSRGPDPALFKIPPNPIVETNRRLRDVEQRIVQVVHASAETAQHVRDLSTSTLVISDKLAEGIQGSRATAKSSVTLAVAAIICAFIVGAVQIGLSIALADQGNTNGAELVQAIERMTEQQRNRDLALAAQLDAAAESMIRNAPTRGAARQRAIASADEMQTAAQALRGSQPE